MNTLQRLTDLTNGIEQQLADFDKRYLNTFMLLDGRVAYYVGRNGHQFHFNMADDDTTIIWDHRNNPEWDIQVLLPSVGYYNVGGTPVYLYKVPQKQWKRSFCSSIYSASNITEGGITGRRGNEAAFKQIALAAIKPIYAHLDELTKPLYAYVALTKKFAIQANHKNDMMLMYRQYMVGRLNFNEKVVEVVQPTLYQEVADFFKYTGVKEWKMK